MVGRRHHVGLQPRRVEQAPCCRHVVAGPANFAHACMSLPQVLNDTLSEGSLSAWKSKMAQKLRTEQTCFSYRWHPSPEAPSRPLDTEADLEALKACYRTALQRRSGEGAAGAQPLLRMLVSLDSSSSLDCSQSSPVVLTRSRSRSLDVPSKLSSGTPGAGQCARATQARPAPEVPSSAQETQQRNNPSPSAVRVQKKHRVHQPAW